MINKLRKLGLKVMHKIGGDRFYKDVEAKLADNPPALEALRGLAQKKVSDLPQFQNIQCTIDLWVKQFAHDWFEIKRTDNIIEFKCHHCKEIKSEYIDEVV